MCVLLLHAACYRQNAIFTSWTLLFRMGGKRLQLMADSLEMGQSSGGFMAENSGNSGGSGVVLAISKLRPC